jgi:hypothetical protein
VRRPVDNLDAPVTDADIIGNLFNIKQMKANPWARGAVHPQLSQTDAKVL